VAKHEAISVTMFFQSGRAPIDEGDKKEVVIDQNIVTADGLAVDWIYSHLYWTDTGTNSIAMSDLDGNLITTIIQDDLQEPRAIALHPEKGSVHSCYLPKLHCRPHCSSICSKPFFASLNPVMLVLLCRP